MKPQRPDRQKTTLSVSYIRIAAIMLAIMLLAGSCNALPRETDSDATTGSTQMISNVTTEAGGTEAITDLSSVVVDLKDEDLDDSWNENQATGILFQEPVIVVTGDGAAVNGSTVTISAAGTYLLSGVLHDGQVLVDADKDAVVRLVLNNLALQSTESAPLQVLSADKVILILADGSETTITDARPASTDDGGDIAADDLSEADEDEEMQDDADKINAAIYSKEDLTITGSGHLTVVTTFRHGINCKDDLVISGGTLSVKASGDGMRGRDSVVVQNADLKIDAGEDGIHADKRIDIYGGSITVDTSYEGIESAAIYIHEGDLRITAADDAINVAGNNAGAAMFGRLGQNRVNLDGTGDQRLEIHGGSIVVDGQGDGIDVNGSILMTGGTVLVIGPTNDMNGALDYDGSFTITGGLLVAAGSAGMAQAPDASSSQYSILVNLSTTIQTETFVHVTNSTGEPIVGFYPVRPIQSLVVSSPDLKKGDTITVFTGGTSQSELVNGLLIGGTVQGGVQAASLTLNQITTTFGSAGMTGGRPGRR